MRSPWRCATMPTMANTPRELQAAPQGSPPRAPRRRDATEHARRARGPRRDPRARDPRLRLVLRVLRDVSRGVSGAANAGRHAAAGLRGGRRLRARRSSVGRAVVLRPPPPGPLRHRRGDRRLVLDAAPAAATKLDVGVGRDDRRRPHRRPVGRGRPGAPRGDAPPTMAWCRSGSPTTRPSGRPSRLPSHSDRKEAGLLSTPHAGELAGPESVRGALDTLQPDRIQHGVRSIEDPELVARLADSDIVLDVCPTSNLLLSVYPSLAEHPLPQLLDGRGPVQPQRRRPAAVRSGAAAEYELVRTEMGLDDDALAFIARARSMARAHPTSSRRRRCSRSTTGSRRAERPSATPNATTCPARHGRDHGHDRQRPRVAARLDQHAAKHRDAERARRLDQRLVHPRRRSRALGPSRRHDELDARHRRRSRCPRRPTCPRRRRPGRLSATTDTAATSAPGASAASPSPRPDRDPTGPPARVQQREQHRGDGRGHEVEPGRERAVVLAVPGSTA